MINRNNYEEFILLYIDGELSSAERQAVESFLELHPDLKEEMALLQQTILQPEEIKFSEKDLLYKGEEGINKGNYQEYFLLYVDEELSAGQKQDVETFVLQNPGLQDEFTLLKQTVLPKEQITFNNKEVLYRKEEKRRPVVISMRWASLAAAVLIGIIATVWIVNSSNQPGVPGEQVATKTPQKKEPVAPATIQPQQVITVTDGSNNAAPLVAGKTEPIRKGGIITTAQQKNRQVQVAVQKQDIPQQTISQPDVIASNSIPANTNPGNYTGTSSNTYSGSAEDTKTIRTSSPDVQDKYIQPAVYKEELNTEGDEKDKNLLVGALQINTDKVRGLFRKAGRFLSNKVKNKDDDGDKVQIANIEVNKLK
jgi:hypothetical protein